MEDTAAADRGQVLLDGIRALGIQLGELVDVQVVRGGEAHEPEPAPMWNGADQEVDTGTERKIRAMHEYDRLSPAEIAERTGLEVVEIERMLEAVPA